MPTTPLGIRYPASTDHTRTWEHWQNLATDVDTLLTKPPTGKASDTNPHTGITAESVSLTVTNMAFRAGWAYRASIRGAIYGSAAGLLAHFRLRKTNLAGADWGEYGRAETKGASVGTSFMVNASLILLRSAATDLLSSVALVVTPSSGTINIFASIASPRYLLIEPIGPAAAYADLGVEVS